VTDLSALVATLPGRVHTDDAARDAVAVDFGGVVRARPLAVVRPVDADDVAATVTFARAHRLPVVARGVGHSTGGQSQASAGIVLDMTTLARVQAPVDGALVVEAGARWADVMDALVDLTPPVLPDWLHLTVGGTLALGGVGPHSFRAGVQCDAVTALEVVTGTGERVRCARGDALFAAVLGGLGQFGVVTEVTLRVEPAPRVATLHHLVWADLDRFLADVARLAADRRVHGLLAHAVPADRAALAASLGPAAFAQVPPEVALPPGPWLFDLELTVYDDGPTPDLHGLGALPGLHTAERMTWTQLLGRKPPIIERDAREGAAPHPQLSMVVPGDLAPTAMRAVLERTTPASMGGGPILLVPIARDLVQTPMFRCGPPDGGALCWLFGVLAAAPTAADVAAVQARNAALYAEVSAAGVLRYPCDALPPPSGPVHHGADWPQVQAWKRRFDPDGLFAPNARPSEG
jgi:cytokinin dehydrogenase